jgi:hypothetical protein
MEELGRTALKAGIKQDVIEFQQRLIDHLKSITLMRERYEGKE